MKVVVVTSRFPFPIEKGDKLRAFYHIKAIAEQHDVYLVALTHSEVSEEDRNVLLEYCADIQIFKVGKLKLYWNIFLALTNGLPLMVGYFYDRQIKRSIHDYILQVEPDHVYAQLIRTSEYVRSLPFKKSIDYMDVFSVGMAQRAKNSLIPISWLYKFESRSLSRYEQLIYPEFDHHAIISVQDRNRLKVTYKDNIAILPNGVDTEYFEPSDHRPRYDLVFVGNMGYLPNIEAAEFLVRNVMPGLIQSNPNVRLLIAGARPARRVKQLAGKNVIISGWLDDIRQGYADGQIFVAPIFSGMGQQNKILEAMSMGKVCVTSTMVNNAVGAKHGEEIFEVTDAHEMESTIRGLLMNPRKIEEIGENARTFILDKYSWETQHEKLRLLLDRKSVLRSSLA